MDSRDLLKSLHDTFATITLRKTRPWLKSTDDVKTVVDIVEQCLMSGMYEESKWDVSSIYPAMIPIANI